MSKSLEPYPGERSLLTAPGVSLATVSLGATDAETVVLLVNGAGANLLMWSPVLGQLAQRYGVVRFDMRGTGRSHADRAPLSLAHYADDAARLLELLDVSKAVVWGTGLGARVALHLALRYPRLVAAIAAYDAGLGPPPSRSERIKSLRWARAAREAEGIPEAATSTRWFLHLDPRHAQDAARAARSDSLAVEDLHAIGTPALVVAGRHDPNLSDAEALASALPCAIFAIMECTGHGSVVERPEPALELLLDFLDRLGLAVRRPPGDRKSHPRSP